MTGRGARLPPLTLPVWAALAVGGAGTVVLGLTSVLLAVVEGRGLGVLEVVPALAVIVGLAAAAHVAAGRVAAGLSSLRADALARLTDPGAPLRTPGEAVRGHTVAATRELADLAATLDALHQRVRVADTAAGRHRLAAEHAAAGMFELLSGLVEAEEGARGQLSAELHDTVAQSLMQARSLLGAPLGDRDLIRLCDLVGDAEEQVRAVMARTRPPALRDGDLARAVGGLVDDLEHRYGLVVDVVWPEDPSPLPLVSAVTVYRFFQEGLLNVVKHADVDEACIWLHTDADGIRAGVSDDGPGFDPDQVRPERGRQVGLGLLRERARLAGGGIVLTAGECAGTTLELTLPATGTSRRAGRPDLRLAG